MKRLTLIMLVAMVPFLTMAQKRSMKDNARESQKKDISQYDFMVIIGNTIKPTGGMGTSSDIRAETRLKISFDAAGVRTRDQEDLSEVQYKSMAHAVNSAGRLGWEFINANVLVEQGTPVYYYYMRKRK